MLPAPTHPIPWSCGSSAVGCVSTPPHGLPSLSPPTCLGSWTQRASYGGHRQVVGWCSVMVCFLLLETSAFM